MGGDWLARAGAIARRHPAAIAISLALVSSIGAWVYSGVRSALVELAADNLNAQAASAALAVQTWIGEKQLNVARWARDPRVIDGAERLLAAADSDAAQRRACAGAPGAGLVQAIDLLRLEDAAAAIHLIDRQGRVLAARNPAMCGLVIDAARWRNFAPALNGQPRFTPTLAEVDRVGLGGSGEGPKVWFTAPVRNAAGEIIAVLDIGKSVDERFSQLFAAAAIGAGGESFAFDQRGLMLTESRHRATLVERGDLRAGESSVLRQPLRDPDVEAEPRPTRLVEQALAGLEATPPRLHGDVRQPYRTYHGEQVVGAWRWLPEHGFGIAVEVPEDEAFAPLRRVELAFLALGLGVGAVAFGFVVALLRIQRMADEAAAAQSLGNYELFEEIGAGGVARVHRAQHRLLKRPTAVKVIHLHASSDELLARFDREVRLASQLMHPNTIEIYDYGRTPEGLPFYAMELLLGLTLQQIVERTGPLPPPRLAHALRGIAGSLSEAHERGLVHRDVTPANIMLCHKGGLYDVPKLLDFGLIKDTRTPHTRDLTRALRVLGTPSYMAPERIEHPDSADARSDLYALGAVAFYCLAGRPPHEGESDLALAYKVVNKPAPAVGTVATQPVPPAFEALIARCLAKVPEERPAAAAEVAAALDLLLLDLPWTNLDARRWWDEHGQTA